MTYLGELQSEYELRGLKKGFQKGAIVFMFVLTVFSVPSCTSLSSPPDSPNVIYNLDVGKKPGLRATFFGTTTVLLTDGVSSILIDGFFTRPSWWRMLRGNLSPDTEEIDFALSKAPRTIDAIFVAHSHHDHAMDSGVVAIKTGAVVYGAESTLNIARGQLTPEKQLKNLVVRSPLQIGKFRVTAYETPHSPKPINVGFITEPLKTPAKLSDYQMAENFSFLVEHPLGKILIVPSANYTPNVFENIKADMVFLGIGALGKQSNEFATTYWNEVVRKTGAKLVFPIHWDDFTKSLRYPLVPLPRILDNVPVGVSRVKDLANIDNITVRFFPVLQEVILPAAQ